MSRRAIPWLLAIFFLVVATSVAQRAKKLSDEHADA